MKTEEIKAALGSYARAFLVAALAVYSTGDMNLKHMLYAGLAAVVGPAIRAINKNDPAFGRCAVVIDHEFHEWIDKMLNDELNKPKPKKKAVKKTPKKK